MHFVKLIELICYYELNKYKMSHIAMFIIISRSTATGIVNDFEMLFRNQSNYFENCVFTYNNKTNN